MEWTERRLHWLFAALALVLGVLYAFVLPPLQTPDEHVHFFRAYDMSDGHLVAVTDAAIPDQLRQLARLFPPRVELQRRITPAELVALATAPPSEEPRVFIGYTPLSLYPFLPYLPPAMTMRAARWLHAPALDLVYLGRLANLGVYIGIVCIAVSLIPDFKLLLCALALMPMTLHQAASLSADSISIAVAFLFCAYVLRLAYEEGPISRTQLWTLAGIVAAVCLCKFIVYLVILVILIPKTRFTERLGVGESHRDSMCRGFIGPIGMAVLQSRQRREISSRPQCDGHCGGRECALRVPGASVVLDGAAAHDGVRRVSAPARICGRSRMAKRAVACLDHRAVLGFACRNRDICRRALRAVYSA